MSNSENTKLLQMKERLKLLRMSHPGKEEKITSIPLDRNQERLDQIKDYDKKLEILRSESADISEQEIKTFEVRV